ncbi:MAG: hypothetical protein MUC88_12090 [Planctomycetes bacterium]|nr:hypothetical protein [Planctomycetota bacterium]
MAVLIVGLAVGWCAVRAHRESVSHYRPVPYEQVANRFVRKSAGWDEPYEVELWALWKELGISPRPFRKARDWSPTSLSWTLRHDPRSLLSSEYASGARRGQKCRVSCHFSEGARAKVISISGEFDPTQVLVFRPQERDGVRSFRFAYAFTAEDGGWADRGSARLTEIEPDLEFLEVSYRNSHGTGTHGTAWTLYRLDPASATRLLKTDDHGWAIGQGPCGYGYRCEITDLAQTWPELGMSFYVEYVPGDPPGTTAQEDPRQDVYTLKTQVRLAWDRDSRTFQSVLTPSLSDAEILALVERPAQFVVEKAEDSAFLSRPGCPLTRSRLPQSECLRGWGL